VKIATIMDLLIILLLIAAGVLMIMTGKPLWIFGN
jgi:hypothetical protein